MVVLIMITSAVDKSHPSRSSILTMIHTLLQQNKKETRMDVEKEGFSISRLLIPAVLRRSF